MSDLFPGFETRRIATTGAQIHCEVGGGGPPLLLLHGYPQTHAMWHGVAPELARRFTVICPDLRGYGDSSKPAGDPAHAQMSKRASAGDMVEVMRASGFERFRVVGHDRGARVSHRLALDHPHAIERMAILDIVPTRAMYAKVDRRFASSYWHWFFLIQPPDLPEKMIGAEPEAYLRRITASFGSSGAFFDPRAMAEYLRCFRDPATIHATCEDYRAAATIDLVHDDGDAAAGRKVACPVLLLWGEKGVVHRCFEPVEEWRAYATDVRGRAVPGGHFFTEENPQETLRELLAFL